MELLGQEHPPFTIAKSSSPFSCQCLYIVISSLAVPFSVCSAGAAVQVPSSLLTTIGSPCLGRGTHADAALPTAGAILVLQRTHDLIVRVRDGKGTRQRRRSRRHREGTRTLLATTPPCDLLLVVVVVVLAATMLWRGCWWTATITEADKCISQGDRIGLSRMGETWAFGPSIKQLAREIATRCYCSSVGTPPPSSHCSRQRVLQETFRRNVCGIGEVSQVIGGGREMGPWATSKKMESCKSGGWRWIS